MRYVVDEVSNKGIVLMRIANAWESANNHDDIGYNREAIKNNSMPDNRGYIHYRFPTFAGIVDTEYNYQAARQENLISSGIIIEMDSVKSHQRMFQEGVNEIFE